MFLSIYILKSIENLYVYELTMGECYMYYCLLSMQQNNWEIHVRKG